MQKVNILITITLLILANATYTQPGVIWSRTFGGERAENCCAVIQTLDGEFAMAGWTETIGEGGSDFWLVVTDNIGQEIYSRTYGGERDDRCHALLQTEDNCFALAGYTESFGEGEKDFWLIMVDEGGGELFWSQTYGGGEDDVCNAIIRIEGGGYALAGNSASFCERGDRNDFWLVETDANGEETNAQAYSFSIDDRCTSVLQRADGGYEMGGSINGTFNRFEYNFCVLITDQEEWPIQWTFLASDAACTSLLRPAEGGLVLAGWNSLGREDSTEFMLRKLDGEEYGIDWWGNYDEYANATCLSVIQTIDSGYAMAGYSDASRDDENDAWLVKTNEVGVHLWSQNYGGEQSDGCNSIIQTPDGEFVMGGYTESFAAGETDFWLLKVEPALFWLTLPDSGFVKDSLLVFELSYFLDYISPSIPMDSLVTYEVINGEYVLGEIDGGELTVSAEESWFGRDSLMLIVSEVRNPDNTDSTYLRLTVSEFISVGESQFSVVSSEFTLHDAYPNPFNFTTTIKYTVPLITNVSLQVFDVNGKLVETLVDGMVPVGMHSVVWDAGGIGAGVYFVRMKDEEGRINGMRRVMLIR